MELLNLQPTNSDIFGLAQGRFARVPAALTTTTDDDISREVLLVEENLPEKSVSIDKNFRPSVYMRRTALLPITHNLWPTNDYVPVSVARLAWLDVGLLVCMTCRETEEPRRVFRQHRSPVSRDSCLEAFIQPLPAVPGYINVEANAVGTVLAGWGPRRENRYLLTDKQIEALYLQHTSEKRDDAWYWQICFVLSSGLLTELMGTEILLQKGNALRANFYKCGDATKYPHYFAWQPIRLPQPDFHQPGYFGNIILD